MNRAFLLTLFLTLMTFSGWLALDRPGRQAGQDSAAGSGSRPVALQQVVTDTPAPTVTPVPYPIPVATAAPATTDSPDASQPASAPRIDFAASDPSKATTIIALASMPDIMLGEPFTISGTVRDWVGQPVVDHPIIFTLEGTYLGQTRTDESGFFQRTFQTSLGVGLYTIAAYFNSTRYLNFSTAATTMKVLPAEVQIQTVPPIAGVTFQIAGGLYVSGPDGSLSIPVNQPGQYRLEVLTDLFHDPVRRIKFGRWLIDSYLPYIDINVPTTSVIQAGLDVYYQVGETFVDLDGNPVDPQRITQFTIRSAQGDNFVLQNGDPTWIPASRVAHWASGLEPTPLLYSVISVIVDGSNVVNQSQQQFYAQPNDIWQISLLLYSLKISGQDGIFGTAIGRSVNLTYPNGQVKNYLLDRDGTVEIPSLARGNYSVQLIGAAGIGTQMPIALSRNQSATIKVVTDADLALVALLGLFLALGLLIFGRRQAILSLLKKGQLADGQGARAEVSPDDDTRPNPVRQPPHDEIIKWS